MNWPEAMSCDTTSGQARKQNCGERMPISGESLTSRSILIGGDDFPAIGGNQATECDQVDRVFEESDTAVTHQYVNATRVVGVEFVVVTRIGALGDQSARFGVRVSFVVG